MPKRFRFAMLCLLAFAMLSLPLTTTTRAIAVQIPIPIMAPIEGCFLINSGITSPSSGKFSFTNAFGSGNFFINLLNRGQGGEDATFNFDLDNSASPGKINGGKFQNDVNLLVTNGSNIFGILNSSSVTGPNANGVITANGIMTIFGGTRTYNLAKGFAFFTLTLYTQDTTINGVTFKANTATFCLSGRILTAAPLIPN